jgi:hypothetical protein
MRLHFTWLKSLIGENQAAVGLLLRQLASGHDDMDFSRPGELF